MARFSTQNYGHNRSGAKSGSGTRRSGSGWWAQPSPMVVILLLVLKSAHPGTSKLSQVSVLPTITTHWCCNLCEWPTALSHHEYNAVPSLNSQTGSKNTRANFAAHIHLTSQSREACTSSAEFTAASTGQQACLVLSSPRHAPEEYGRPVW